MILHTFHRSTPALARLVACALAPALIAPAARSAPQGWAKQFGTAGSDGLSELISDGAGGTLAVGWAQGPLGGPVIGLHDVYVERRDGAGDLVWTRQIGTTLFDFGVAIAPDGQGGSFVSGVTRGDWGGINQGLSDAFLAHLDATGNLLQVVSFGSSVGEEVFSAAPDDAGGVYLTGSTTGSLFGPAQGGSDVWLAHFDANAALLWSKQIGTPESEDPSFVSADGSGGVLIGGWTRGDLGGPSGGGRDGWYANYDAAGNLLWMRQVGGPHDDIVKHCIPDGAGGHYLSGGVRENFPDVAGLGAFVQRLDAAGTVLWSHYKYVHSTSDQTVRMVLDGSGGVFGFVSSYFFHAMQAGADWNEQPTLRRFDGAGNLLLDIPFGSEEYDNPAGIVSDGAGGVILGGHAEGDMYAPVKGTSDPWIARLEACDFAAFSTFCTSSVNSTGLAAQVGHWGSSSVVRNDLALTVDHCPTNQLGLFLIADQQNGTPFGNGTLCVGGSVSRFLPAQIALYSGWAHLFLDNTDPSSPASQVTAGSTWYFQFWYRDPAGGGAQFNLSNGLGVTFCP